MGDYCTACGRSEGAHQVPCIRCIDCGRAPPPIDLVLPRAQWLLIHPDDGGVLCANCMLTRAEKLPHAINVTGLVTFGHQLDGEGPTPYEAISKLAEAKEPM